MFGRSRRDKKQLEELVRSFTGHLPRQNLEDAKELIDHGEPGEALDLICTQLYELEIQISPSEYETIEALGHRMEMDVSTWAFLKELVEQQADAPDDFEEYERMHARGSTAEDAYCKAVANGLARLRAIRMLRAVFSLSLQKAVDLAASAPCSKARRGSHRRGSGIRE